MSIFSKVKIGQAATDYSKFDLSSDHLTTTDFGQINVVNCCDMIIGDKVKYSFNNFTRCAPMVFPTYGKIGQRVISAFVPYHLVADDADSFISGLKAYNGSVPVGRFFHMSDLLAQFCQDIYSNKGAHYLQFVLTESDEAKKIMDIFYADGAQGNIPRNYFIVHTKKTSDPDTFSYGVFKLNHRGKYFYKLLRSLGYDLPQLIQNHSSNKFTSSLDGVVLNAYPLLCYLKVFADLIIPNAFYQTSKVCRFLNQIKTRHTVDSGGFIPLGDFNAIFDEICKCYYDSDYFTSAWQSINSPLSTVSTSQDSIYDQASGIEVDNSINSPRVLDSESLSARQLSFLQSFDRFVRRNNLIGFKEFNAIYSRFGIKPSEMKSQYVYVLDVRNIDMAVGDVTATSDNDDTVLGAYAGKGILQGGSSFDFECKDYGMFIQLAYVYVKPIYNQGIRKHCLRKDCFDFYQPEFDGVGPAPISVLELDSINVEGNQVFGFTERYNDYRFKLSDVTGDFALDPDMMPWHTAREFNHNTVHKAQLPHILQYSFDARGNNEYDRIFSTQNLYNPYDHFYQVWNFKMDVFRKMKNINQSLNLGSGDILLDRNGSV